MNTWDAKGQETFIATMLDFWPALNQGRDGMRELTMRTYFEGLCRYPVSMVIASLREMKARRESNTPPALEAIQDEVSARHHRIRRRHDEAVVNAISAQEFASEDPDGWWADRESGRQAAWYRTARQGLFEGKTLTQIMRSWGGVS